MCAPKRVGAHRGAPRWSVHRAALPPAGRSRAQHLCHVRPCSAPRTAVRSLGGAECESRPHGQGEAVAIASMPWDRWLVPLTISARTGRRRACSNWAAPQRGVKRSGVPVHLGFRIASWVTELSRVAIVEWFPPVGTTAFPSQLQGPRPRRLPQQCAEVLLASPAPLTPPLWWTTRHRQRHSRSGPSSSPSLSPAQIPVKVVVKSGVDQRGDLSAERGSHDAAVEEGEVGRRGPIRPSRPGPLSDDHLLTRRDQVVADLTIWRSSPRPRRLRLA